MLQTELTTNTAVNAQTPNGVAKKGDILKRIEALNKWQEEQKKLLEARQTLQRKMLGMEQKTMYEMLGLENESKISMIEGLKKCVKEQNTPVEVVEQSEEYEEMTEMTDESLETSQLDAEGIEEDSNDIDPAIYEALSSVYDKEMSTNEKMKPKKPFLKRGDGLKQRFKIDPDELRLNNLPKYKYANAHPKLRLKPINFSKANKDLKTPSTNQANSSSSNTKPPSHPATLDAKEQRFQNLLITSKNTCSSTPDVKTVKSTSAAAQNKNSKEEIQPPRIRECKSTEAAKTNSAATNVVAWSKILDPSEIQPLQVPRNCVQTLPQSEETIFELLEQKANEGSFDMDSTCLKDFMTRRITEKLNESDDNIIVQEQLKTKRLEPVLNDKALQDYSGGCSSEEVEEEESQFTDDMKSSESDDSTHKTVETANSPYPQQTSQVRVRFSDSNETHEYEEEPSFNDGSRLPAGRNPQGQGDDTGNNDLFIQFKHALFSVLQLKADQPLGNDLSLKSVSDTTLTPKNSLVNAKNCENTDSIYAPACKELQDKTDLIKTRLSELEKEIQNFKNSNVMLLKAKQEHELQKSLNAQQHLEAMESLKDEKIRMEIYLHDERAKLEDDKRQFEQNLKMKNQTALAKERKENERLRQHIAQLEMQLKTKENNHTTAQARLRSQIRNLEKEQSKLHEQIENLAKEVKRLENENLKISREQSNKILLEINRNIAKLAPKQIQNSSTSTSDEGNTALSATLSVSKCIVAAATANRNVGKGHKGSTTKFSNVKTMANKKATLQKYEETERALELSFTERKQQQQQQKQEHTNYKLSDDEDDDEILREIQITSEKRKHKQAGGAQKNGDGKYATHTSPKGQKTPEAPPSSPRTCSGSNNMKREIVNSDGSKDIWYPNGNLKKISADGMIIRMLYYNKDIKETNINEGTVKYYYAETNTWHTTYLDGLEILEFPNGQIEHRHKNGVVEVHYPNNSVKITNPKDEQKQEEWRFPDGTHLVQMHNGDKILTMPNGQKEIHNKLHKRREYPDGTIKIIYPDGSAETRYSNGRVRLKDKEGKLVMDTEMAK